MDISLNEAYMHLQYAVIPKVFNKTEKDTEVLQIALDAIAKVEAMNQLLEGVKENG